MADGKVEISVNLDNKEAEKKLSDLRRSIERTAKSIESTGGKKAAITEQLEQARKEAAATAKELEELNAQKIENEATLSGRTGDVSLEEFEARKQAQAEITYQLKEQEKLQASQNSNIAKLEEKERALTAQIEQQTASLEKQKSEAGEVERVIASQASSAMPQLAASAEAVSKSMRKGFKSILKWGFGIRSAFILMRRLRSAAVEGIKAFAESDAETKANIDGLKSSLATLKASWGAAFAPVFNAVVPILQKLISWLTTAVNAVAMFFAALTGKGTYKKAIAGNNALAKSYGGAGGAAEKAEKQILGFDEINKLNAESSGGGGGGGGAGDIAEQFEEIPILESFKRHLDDILIIVGLIGSALLAWKLAPLLGISFAKMLGILAAIIGLVEMVHGGLDAWNNGVNWENFFDMLKGAALLVGGLALAFGKTGAAIGLLIAGIGMLAVGLHDWITTGELSTQTFYMLEAAILAIGGAIALLTGSWIPLVIAAVAGLVLAVVKNWDNIKQKFKVGAEELKQDWENIKEAFRELGDYFAEIGKMIWQHWQNAVAKFKAGGEDLKQDLLNIKNFFSDTWNNVKDAASRAWEGIKEVVRSGVDTLKNLMLFQWQLPHISLPHIQVSWTDTSNSSIAKLLGITAIPNFSIAWYARGGIVDGATLIGAGEAGKEAIIPLERNTEWISMVARGLVDNLTSSNRLADYISDLPFPSIAQGQIVPPRALSGSGSVFSDGDIERLVRGITAAFTQDGGEQIIIKTYLDGKQVAESVTRHQRRMERGYA